MGEYSVAYRGCRERVAELVARLDDVELNRRVPACPDWTVRDLTAHIVGVAADFSVGNLERVGGDEWTGTQIAKRADRSVADLMDEWTELAEQVEPAADLIPPGAAQMLVGDAVTHEHDMSQVGVPFQQFHSAKRTRGAGSRAGAMSFSPPSSPTIKESNTWEL